MQGNSDMMLPVSLVLKPARAMTLPLSRIAPRPPTLKARGFRQGFLGQAPGNGGSLEPHRMGELPGILFDRPNRSGAPHGLPTGALDEFLFIEQTNG